MNTDSVMTRIEAKMTMMDDWIDETIGALVRERDNANEKMICANNENDTLRKQLDIAVAAMHKANEEANSGWEMTEILVGALIKIEQLSANAETTQNNEMRFPKDERGIEYCDPSGGMLK
jgi:uncharacterized coiled-coil DUF342 family protein